MALTYSTNTYAGLAAKEKIADMLLMGKTIKDGAIMVHPKIKGKEVIQTITTDAVFQARADTFTASGATAVGERTLSITNLMSEDQVGVTVLLNTWQTMSQADSANDKELPTDMATFLEQRKAEIINNQIDELIWRGDTTLTGNAIRKWHDGLITLALADSGVTKYTATTGQITFNAITVGATTALTSTAAHNLLIGDKVTLFNFAGADAATLNGLTFTVLTTPTTTTLTLDAVTTGLTITDNTDAAFGQSINKSNVLTYLQQAFNVSREQDRRQPDFRIYVPVHVAEAYIDKSLDVATGQGNAYEKAGNLVFKGVPLQVCNYFPENTIFTSPVSNLWFGTDLESDLNEVNTLYMKPVTGDDVYRFITKFGSCVNYGFAAQIKMIRPSLT